VSAWRRQEPDGFGVFPKDGEGARLERPRRFCRDPQLSKGVVARLQKDGYAIPIAKPRAATAADMRGADIVISMGCDLSKLPAPTGVLKTWNVPDFSADFDVAEQSIRDQVTKLVDELMAAQRAKQ
jgi:protein-tyrosine-phosphatase